MLKINNLSIRVGKKEIVKNISWQIKPGEIQVLMGPNGSGKSTFAQALAGQNFYKTFGNVSLDDHRILKLSPDQRAKRGLLVIFQQPVNITGVKVFDFLKSSFDKFFPKQKLSVAEFRSLISKMIKKLGLEENHLQRALNHQFSGGERKRLELLQALLFKPKYIIFDEIDSGIDIDGLRIIGKVVKRLQKQKTGILLITHQPKILKFVKPDKIHILLNGQIVKSGKAEVLQRLERSGYQSFYCALCVCGEKFCPKHRKKI